MVQQICSCTHSTGIRRQQIIISGSNRLEKAFECWDPIVPGQAQLQLPERIHQNTYNWEGEMITFDKTSKRINGNRFIFEDGAINCWGKVDSGKPLPYVDGKQV